MLMLLAGATTQLINVHGGTAPQWAEVQGQPTTAELGRQHTAPPLQKVVNWQTTLLSGGAAPAPGQAETGAVAAAVAPLPTGWKDAKAPDGRTYYFHTETKETTWTRPAAALAAPAAADPPLPAGWKQAKAADGRTYYYYLPEGKRTQWVREQP